MAINKKIVLGKVVAFKDLFEDVAFFPYIFTKGQGSHTHSKPGYYFMSIKKAGKTDFNKREGGKEYMLYAKPTQLLIDAYKGNAISGLGSFEIIANPHWLAEGGALVIARDDVMISSPWIALVDVTDLPDFNKVEVVEL